MRRPERWGDGSMHCGHRSGDEVDGIRQQIFTGVFFVVQLKTYLECQCWAKRQKQTANGQRQKILLLKVP